MLLCLTGNLCIQQSGNLTLDQLLTNSTIELRCSVIAVMTERPSWSNDSDKVNLCNVIIIIMITIIIRFVKRQNVASGQEQSCKLNRMKSPTE